jgi:hypothetical protein
MVPMYYSMKLPTLITPLQFSPQSKVYWMKNRRPYLLQEKRVCQEFYTGLDERYLLPSVFIHIWSIRQTLGYKCSRGAFFSVDHISCWPLFISYYYPQNRVNFNGLVDDQLFFLN